MIEYAFLDIASDDRMCLLFYHPLLKSVNGLLPYRLSLQLRTASDTGRIFYGSLTPWTLRARPLLPELHLFGF
jgi:hypothetical protein